MQRKTTIEKLPCKLTEREQVLKSKALGAELEELERLEAEKADSARQYKELIDTKNKRVRELAQEVRDGAELRMVECYERPKYREGVIELVRSDTREVVSTRKMSDADRQTTLDEQYEEKKKRGRLLPPPRTNGIDGDFHV